MVGAVDKDDVVRKQKVGLETLNDPKVDVKELTALNVRFALAGDDNLYLQAGVTLLHVDKHDKFELAPARLYSADVLEATKQGLIAAKNASNAIRRADSDDELKVLFRAFYEYAIIFLPSTEGIWPVRHERLHSCRTSRSKGQGCSGRSRRGK